ncbi:protein DETOXIFICATION 19-like isoform X2 [Solanum tuberosum]|uniref:protein DETOXIFICATION 19-like isoform X2 n=1 Tax=Solanum tuberosum TaxID=4113 RepID=UPI00073A5047|nr:PREDICTED: protein DETOXIFICATION 19-like isoform X2 [Solanum tuberosum]
MASENCSSGPKSPLLGSSSSSSGISSNSWCAKLIDVEEAKNQMLFSLPMIVVNSCFYFINLVSVMFAGHLGKLELAASNLANSWAMVTGFSFMAQSIIMPLAFCSVGSLVIHIGISYALVHWTGLAFKGASLAASISIWISLLTLGLYVLLSKRFNHIWRDGLSFEPFHHILTNLKLALPSAAMVCLEYWAFELLVLLAGLMPNSGTTTSVVAMCVNTQNIAYMISYGLSAAASTRVANELGAGNPDKAKHAMFVTLKLSVLLAIAVDLALFLGHNVWASLFSDSAEIINKFASMTPLLLISFVFDFIQGILSGVTRGCGWQHLAMCINLATFYFIGMPIAGLLAFTFNLHSQGLWLGLICGLACQSSGLFLLTLMTRWGKVAEVSTNSNRENVLLA